MTLCQNITLDFDDEMKSTRKLLEQLLITIDHDIVGALRAQPNEHDIESSVGNDMAAD